MKEAGRIFHLWRYAFRALSLELMLYHLALLAYAGSSWWLGLRARAGLEETALPCLMVAAAWLAGRIMLVDPLERPRAFWRTMPWTAREMAWARTGLVMVAVFVPWVLAQSVRLLALRPGPEVFLSALANALGFWPLMALSALAAGLSRSLVMWLLSPVAAFGVMALLNSLNLEAGGRPELAEVPLPWSLVDHWHAARSLHVAGGAGAVLVLTGLILLGWRAGRCWGWGLILMILLMAGFNGFLASWSNPPLVNKSAVVFPETGGQPQAAGIGGVAGLENGEFLELREFEGTFQPENGGRATVTPWAVQSPNGLMTELKQSFPEALRVGTWGREGQKPFLVPEPGQERPSGPRALNMLPPGPGKLTVNAVFDVCRMELLADWPLTVGAESVTFGQHWQLEALTQDESSVRASVAMESAEAWSGNFLRKHRLPGALVFVLVTRDGTMIRPGGENEVYLSRNFFNGRVSRVFALSWAGILTDPWATGAAQEWMEGCRLKVYAGVVQGSAVQRIDRKVSRFPDASGAGKNR